MKRLSLGPILLGAVAGTILWTMACSSDSDGGSSSGGSSSGATSGGTDGGGGGGDGTTPAAGDGGITKVGTSEAKDIVGTGGLVFFDGVTDGEASILAATTSTAPRTLCKAGANKEITALAVKGGATDGTVFAIQHDPATGASAIVKASVTATGGACEQVGKITTDPLTELAIVGNSLVYLGNGKVLALPIAGGTEAEVMQSAGTGLIGDFGASGDFGFVVDTSTAATPGARIVRFKIGAGNESMVSVDSPQDSAYEVNVAGGFLSYAVHTANAGELTIRTLRAADPVPQTPADTVTVDYGTGAVLTFCRNSGPASDRVAVTATSENTIRFNLTKLSGPSPSREVTKIESFFPAAPCLLTTGGSSVDSIWAIDPTDKHVFWVAL